MGWTRGLRLIGVVGLILALYALVPVSRDPHGGLPLRVAVTVVLVAALTAGLLWQLRASVTDGDRRVDGLVAAIVTVLTVFALAFYVLQLRDPGQLAGLHTRLDSLYFSASTMLTVGYGDVHAVGQIARAVVLLQMVFDVVFVATAVTLLSSRVRRAAAARAVNRG
jgi:voltage-gated potassium channel